MVWSAQRAALRRPAPPQDGAAAAVAGGGLDPILAYNAGQQINQLQWSSAQPDWVAICFGNRAQVLRV